MDPIEYAKTNITELLARLKGLQTREEQEKAVHKFFSDQGLKFAPIDPEKVLQLFAQKTNNG